MFKYLNRIFLQFMVILNLPRREIKKFLKRKLKQIDIFSVRQLEQDLDGSPVQGGLGDGGS